MEKIYKTLKNIASKINRVPQSNLINCGGCCWFSSLVAEELENLNIPYQVIILHDSEDSEDLDIIHSLSSNSKFVEGAYHVMLKIDGYYYDSLGMNRRISDEYSDRVSDSAHNWNSNLLRVWYEMGSWNERFQYIEDKNINKIENIIKDEFKSSF